MTQQTKETPVYGGNSTEIKRPSVDWLVGGGELGELVRNRDWSSSPLGPRENWPQSLRTTLSLLLQSKVPMALMWGPDLLLFYNDAALGIYAAQHPHAVGRPMRESWPEVLERRRKVVSAVMTHGESFFLEDTSISTNVHGRLENLYFKNSVNPVRIEDGSVGGIFVTFHETTAAIARQREIEQAKETLDAHRAKLEASFESMTDAVWTTAADGTLMDFNKAFATFHRFATKEECPKTFGEYADLLDVFELDGTQAPNERRAIVRALRGETATNVEYMLRRKDTRQTWFGSYSFAPIRSAEGQIVGAVAVARDITEKKRAEEALRASEHKYSTLFDKAPFALAICEWPNGAFVEVNEMFLQTFEYTREEVIGKTGALMGRGNTEDQKRFREAFLTHGSLRDFELARYTKSGKELIVSIQTDPILLGDRKYILTSGQDVTARHEAEKAKRLYQRTKELEELKTQFFSNVSHELRTPLSLIIGPTEQLLQAPETPPHIREQLAVVSRNAQTLLGYVNNLLDVAKLEANHMKAEYCETDLTRLARLVASLFDILSHDQRILFELDVPDRLVAQVDPEKIRRILLNLLSNAFHFAPGGGVVRLTLRETPDRVFIEVADNGPGIPKDRREVVFERFGTSNPGGTGLGLSISREFALLHGGSISVTDAPEGGALFVVDLQRMAPAGTVVHSEVKERENLSNRTARAPVSEPLQAPLSAVASDTLVLVIEDNPEMNRFIANNLSNEYRVEVAFHGREGLEKAIALKPNLILCDLMMPEMAGKEVVREIRRHPELEKTPIIVLSAKADDDERIRLLREGAQDYLTKPFHVEELRTRVRNLVREKRSEDAQRVLAEFGAALASLDYEKTLHELVRLAVRSLADYAHLYLLEEDGQPRRIATASRDPAFDWCAKILGIMPADKKTPHPTLTTVVAQRPVLQHFTVDMAMCGLRQEDLRQLRPTLPQSVMGVPLLVGERCLGALMLWSVSRAYGPSDLQLSEELGRRCAFFIENSRLYQAEKLATQARNDVLGIVAHDLRNPLASIILEAGIVQQCADTDAVKEAADSIEETALRMNRIIQDLLDVVRFEGGRMSMHLTAVSSAHVIAKVVEAHKGLTAKASLALHADITPNLPPILTDQHRLVQVFENLLANAIKFTKPGGMIAIRGTRRNNDVLFSVADSGIGIATKDIPHIFDRFWRVDKRESRGAGLGLAIVKGIVQSQGGRIWVDSKEGAGSTFYFTVPIATSMEANEISSNLPRSPTTH